MIGKQVKTLLRSLAKNDDQKILSPYQNLLDIKVSNPRFSRIFMESEISHRKTKEEPLFTSAHEEKRIEFELSHCDPKFYWSKWIFSDERKLNLDGPYGYKCYWHIENVHSRIFSKDSNSRSSVIIWGGISKNGCTSLLKVPKKYNSKKYCELVNKVIDSMSTRMKKVIGTKRNQLIANQ